MEWIILSKSSPESNRPIQGLKVLCFNRGDCYVAQRFNYSGVDYWIPISFATVDFSTDALEMFAYISFPNGSKGLMRVRNPDTGLLISLDELQKRFPDVHEKVVELMINCVGKCKMCGKITNE